MAVTPHHPHRHRDGRGGPEQPTRANPPGAFPENRPPFSPAWFAGADLRILKKTRSEKGFYDRLGLGVVLLATLNGLTLCIAAGYVLQVPPAHLLWLGFIWAVILACGVEPLVLQVTSSQKRWLPLVLVPRIVLSVLLAVQLGEPIVLRINQDKIDNYLSAHSRDAVQAARRTAAKYYDTKILAAKTEIARLRRNEQRVSANVERYRFLAASCTSDAPELCQHFARRITQRQGVLDAIRARHVGRIRGLKKRIADLRDDRRQDIADRKTAIKHDRGIPAREAALAHLQETQPGLTAQVWYWRILFLVLDLIPLGAKVAHVLTGSPYERMLAAARRGDATDALEAEEAARVREKRIKAQADADIEGDRIEIQLGLSQRVDRAEAAAAGTPYGNGFTPRGYEPIDAWDLDTFADEMTAHERGPVPVPDALRRGGLIGFALLVVLAVTAFLWSSLTGRAVTGTWLIALALVPACVLAVATHGFRQAPAWGLRATFAALLAGLLLPLVVLAINL